MHLPHTDTRMRVLVVEDDFVLASNLATELTRLGAKVIGPFRDAYDAIVQLDKAEAAILDVRLLGETAFPIADCLLSRQTPFVFYSGLDASGIPGRYGHIKLFQKPTNSELLLRHLSRMQDRGTDEVESAIPFLRLEARKLMGDETAADRLVEATLTIAIQGQPGPPRGSRRRLIAWLIEVLRAEFERNGRRLMN